MAVKGDCTYQLDAPSQHRGLEVFVVGQLAPLEDLDGVDDGQTAVELATRNIVVEVLHAFQRCRSPHEDKARAHP